MALFPMGMKAPAKVKTRLVDESKKQGYNINQYFEAALEGDQTYC